MSMCTAYVACKEKISVDNEINEGQAVSAITCCRTFVNIEAFTLQLI